MDPFDRKRKRIEFILKTAIDDHRQLTKDAISIQIYKSTLCTTINIAALGYFTSTFTHTIPKIATYFRLLNKTKEANTADTIIIILTITTAILLIKSLYHNLKTVSTKISFGFPFGDYEKRANEIIKESGDKFEPTLLNTIATTNKQIIKTIEKINTVSKQQKKSADTLTISIISLIALQIANSIQ